MDESAGRLGAAEGPEPGAAERPGPGAPRSADPETAAASGARAAIDPDDDVPPPPPPLEKPGDRRLLRRFRGFMADLFRGVWRKGEEDRIFFLAGAISFDIMVAFVPLLVAVVGIAGTVLRFQGADAQQTILNYLARTIPAAVNLDVEPILEELAQRSTGLLSVGTLFFLWIATRLVGTLRNVLRDIFDIPTGRPIISGKIFDIKMVFAAGTLFALNMVLTLGLRTGAGFVSQVLGIHPEEIAFIGLATQFWPQIVAFVTIWVMFVLIYRYLPPRRIKWSTATTAATFTSLFGELLKYGFSWYVTGVADFRSAWGNVATFVILVLWIYYTSVVFILGGQVAQVVTMRRVRRRQKERLA